MAVLSTYFFSLLSRRNVIRGIKIPRWKREKKTFECETFFARKESRIRFPRVVFQGRGKVSRETFLPFFRNSSKFHFPTDGWMGNFDTRIRMRNGTLSAGIRLHFLPPSCNCRGCRQPVVSTRLDPTGNPVFARKFLSTPSISLQSVLKLFPKAFAKLRNRDENRHTEIEK